MCGFLDGRKNCHRLAFQRDSAHWLELLYAIFSCTIRFLHGLASREFSSTLSFRQYAQLLLLKTILHETAVNSCRRVFLFSIDVLVLILQITVFSHIGKTHILPRIIAACSSFTIILHTRLFYECGSLIFVNCYKCCTKCFIHLVPLSTLQLEVGFDAHGFIPLLPACGLPLSCLLNYCVWRLIEPI